MKRETKILDATPNKRLFWSIISDYSLQTSICELVDNALDIWLKDKKRKKLSISISVNLDNHTILISDNAGGVRESDLNMLISPGASQNTAEEHIIGMFGVGSKRAVVALAKNIKIKTRFSNRKSFQIDIDDEWLKTDDWNMPIYECGKIEKGTTLVELSALRFSLSKDELDSLEQHLAETYSFFIENQNFEIEVNGEFLNPTKFDNWAYPPEYEPRYYMSEIPIENSDNVGVEIYAGLIVERDPLGEDYGVYFYCNDRLIMKHVKSREVGYVSGVAGRPHSDASLSRVIVKISGKARHMPWNSTKSAINFSDPIFSSLSSSLYPIVKDFSSLSRRFKGSWEDNVFKHTKGEMKYIEVEDLKKSKSSLLPPLPKVRKSALDHLLSKNQKLVGKKPWILGLLDAVVMQEIIGKQRLETRNRIGLIVLDSTFEIALKEFIVHHPSIDRGGKSLEELFKNRDKVISIVKKEVNLKKSTLERIRHYYQLRCKLIHEKATLDVTDSDINNFRMAVEECLDKLFGIKL